MRDLSGSGRRSWLCAILLIGLALRVFRLDWGLPGYNFPDDYVHFIRPAGRLVGNGEFVPEMFVHPPVMVYSLGLVYFVWSLASGQTINVLPASLQVQLLALAKLGPGAPAARFTEQLATLTLLGRGFTAVVATASVGILYLLVRRLCGTRAALFASAAFALSPVHVLESHRVNSDVPMILLILIAAHQAVLAAEQRNRVRLLAAFALAGLAGATKYTGLSGLTVPAWIALRWPNAPLTPKLKLLVAGGVSALAGFALGMAPAAFAWEKFSSALSWLLLGGFFAGQPGEDLAGQGWMYLRYVYGLVVVLPYILGWPVYVMSAVGLGALAWIKPRAFGIVLAAIGPFYLVQGAAETVVARYYLPLAPFLAVTAGFALERLWSVRRWAGAAIAAAVLGHTAILAGSHCLRLGLGPQREVRAAIARSLAATTGRDLVVAYPYGAWFAYDAVWPALIQRGTTVVHGRRFKADTFVHRNTRWVNLLARLLGTPPIPLQPPSGKPHGEDDAATEGRRWLEEQHIDVVVMPDRTENLIQREGSGGAEASLVRHLEDGQLGFRLMGHFRTHFFTEWLYVWSDPILREHSTVGIAGYKVFVRNELVLDSP